jgi:hypothetical protein
VDVREPRCGRGRPRSLGIAIAAAAVLSSIADAQTPDIFINIDGRMQFLSQQTGPTQIRLYDNLGRHSVASVTAFLEIGFKGFVSQKLERIANDADRDQLDEYYLEDEGIWRVGKQYLPFGSGRFLHESVLAARGDTQLFIEDLPIVAAICDNGPLRQRGVVGRIGSRLRFSFAIGSHFGINGTSFDLVRRPEDSPGVGHGYKEMYAVDVSKNLGSEFTIGGELIVMRRGHTASDGDNTMFDISGTLRADPRRQITGGWTRDNRQHADFYRLGGSFFVSRYLIFEPMVRYREGGLYDAALTFHFKV